MTANKTSAKTNANKPDTGFAVESNVKKPRGIRQPDPDSILSQIIELAVGATYARAERLDVDSTTWADLVEAKARMRATMSTQVARANKALAGDGGRVSLAIGDFRSQEGDLLVCATVTRIQ